MMFALSTKSLKQYSLEQSIEYIANAGFKAVDIFADKPHLQPSAFTASKAAQLQNLLQEKQITAVDLDAYGITDRNSSWLSEDWKEREKYIHYTLDCARVAAAMGIKYVTISAGSLIPESMDYHEAWRLFIANMFRTLSVIGRLGVTILIRPAPDILISTSDQVIAFLKELEFPPQLGVAFDAAHAQCAGENPCEAVQKILPYTACIHLSDVFCSEPHSHVQLGEGELDIMGFLTCLLDLAYSGYIIIDPNTSEAPTKESLEQLGNWLKNNGFWQ